MPYASGSGPKSDRVRDAIDESNFRKKICQDCNANNGKNADKCRKCGSTSLRRKRNSFKQDSKKTTREKMNESPFEW